MPVRVGTGVRDLSVGPFCRSRHQGDSSGRPTPWGSDIRAEIAAAREVGRLLGPSDRYPAASNEDTWPISALSDQHALVSIDMLLLIAVSSEVHHRCGSLIGIPYFFGMHHS